MHSPPPPSAPPGTAEGEQRFRAVFEHAALGIALLGEDGRILEGNPALQRMLGYSAEELRGLDLLEITHPESRIKHWQLLTELLEGERAKFQVEKRYLHRNGSIVWGRLTASLVGGPGEGRYVVGLMEDVTQRKWAEEQMEKIGTNDLLTGLLNRRGFFLLGESQWRVARRTGRGLTLLVVDIDDLSGLNRRLGWRAGDGVLAEVAEMLRSTCRDSDLVARLGPDEFAVLALEAEPETAVLLARRLEERLLAHNAVASDRWLSLSVGVAELDPSDPLPLEALLAGAERMIHRQPLRVPGAMQD